MRTRHIIEAWEQVEALQKIKNKKTKQNMVITGNNMITLSAD